MQRTRSRLWPQLRSVEPLQSVAVHIRTYIRTYCLTVPACGRATSALSARYTRRTYAIVAYATRGEDEFSRCYSAAFDPRFSNRSSVTRKLVGRLPPERYSFLVFFSVNSIKISTMHTAARRQALYSIYRESSNRGCSIVPMVNPGEASFLRVTAPR